jgi:hypothetical protein
VDDATATEHIPADERSVPRTAGQRDRGALAQSLMRAPLVVEVDVDRENPEEMPFVQ